VVSTALDGYSSTKVPCRTGSRRAHAGGEGHGRGAAARRKARRCDRTAADGDLSGCRTVATRGMQREILERCCVQMRIGQLRHTQKMRALHAQSRRVSNAKHATWHASGPLVPQRRRQCDLGPAWSVFFPYCIHSRGIRVSSLTLLPRQLARRQLCRRLSALACVIESMAAVSVQSLWPRIKAVYSSASQNGAAASIAHKTITSRDSRLGVSYILRVAAKLKDKPTASSRDQPR
jgi:hypothetical protein